jgi:hypothetical protein
MKSSRMDLRQRYLLCRFLVQQMERLEQRLASRTLNVRPLFDFNKAKFMYVSIVERVSDTATTGFLQCIRHFGGGA